MGDFRAECHIKFELNGIKDEFYADWINWDGYDDGVDSRVREFFKRIWDIAQDEFHDSCAKYEEEQREKNEKKEFERLKKKYEPSNALESDTK